MDFIATGWSTTTTNIARTFPARRLPSRNGRVSAFNFPFSTSVTSLSVSSKRSLDSITRSNSSTFKCSTIPLTKPVKSRVPALNATPRRVCPSATFTAPTAKASKPAPSKTVSKLPAANSLPSLTLTSFRSPTFSAAPFPISRIPKLAWRKHAGPISIATIRCSRALNPFCSTATLS